MRPKHCATLKSKRLTKTELQTRQYAYNLSSAYWWHVLKILNWKAWHSLHEKICFTYLGDKRCWSPVLSSPKERLGNLHQRQRVTMQPKHWQNTYEYLYRRYFEVAQPMNLQMQRTLLHTIKEVTVLKLPFYFHFGLFQTGSSCSSSHCARKANK
jgi:hypothetical protein